MVITVMNKYYYIHLVLSIYIYRILVYILVYIYIYIYIYNKCFNRITRANQKARQTTSITMIHRIVYP